MLRRLFPFLFVLFSTSVPVDIHVGPAGSRYQPLSTCTETLQRHDTNCILHGGVYTDSVVVDGYNNHNIQFRGAEGEEAVMSGVVYLPSGLPWSPGTSRKLAGGKFFSASGVYCTSLKNHINVTNFVQVFYGSGYEVSTAQMLFEARWPNVEKFGEILSTNSWAKTDNGSVYGKIVSQALAKTGIDWTGAWGTLNVGDQDNTYTRRITDHSAGASAFHYPKDLPYLGADGSPKKADDTQIWSGNQFYLMGKYEALDNPGEWHFEKSNYQFCMIPPKGHTGPPQSEMVAIKVNDYAFNVRNKANVGISDLKFFGTTITSTNAPALSVVNTELFFPSYVREIAETSVSKGRSPYTYIDGDGCTVNNVTIRFTPTSGLQVFGNHCTVHNVLVHSTAWMGLGRFPAVKLSGQQLQASRLTVTYFGGPGITTNYIDYLEYTLVHHGGLIGKDTAAIYTYGEEANGTQWRYNWVHSVREKCARGDDQTRNLTIHHCVLWDCGEAPLDDGRPVEGVIVKGDYNDLYSNTIWNTASASLALPACIEPYKPWKHHQMPRVMQNKHTQVVNMALESEDGRPTCKGPKYPVGGNQTAVYKGHYTTFMLKNISGYDFRPEMGSPLIGAGIPYRGSHAPVDIGAYQHDETPYWVPGCTHTPQCSTQS